MISNKPRIGYTTRNFSLDPLQMLIHIAIKMVGGQPVRLRPKKPKYNQGIDALIIGGGTDLYPPIYKIDPKPDYKYDHARDEMEIKWFEKADAENMPVLGICRGAQLMNVRRGGTLHMDVAKVYENAQYPTSFFANIFYRKPIDIVPATLLYKILKTARIEVNSIHKQAIDHLGKDLVVTAQEENDVVQAIEDSSRDFFMGVQFHPEALIYKSDFLNIFTALVKSAKINQ